MDGVDIWPEWEQAVVANRWDDARRLILAPSTFFSRETGKVLKPAALAALAEKHLRKIRDDFDTDAISRRLPRTQAATILRDCRVRNISVDMCFYDLLLDLCWT